MGHIYRSQIWVQTGDALRLMAAMAFSEDVSSALVAKIAAGLAWVPNDV